MSSLVGGGALFRHHHHHCKTTTLRPNNKKKMNKFSAPLVMCRLFGPSIFDASKLKVVFVGNNQKQEPIPRTYTLTHCDLTSNLTLSVAQTINTTQLQGWYNKLQRDEVIGEWKEMNGQMCLHVHCHISGGHFLLDLFANLRYYIFCRELPMVLKAFLHGDCNLFENYPELQEAMVFVYFHSNNPKFDLVECWGPLSLASSGAHDKWVGNDGDTIKWEDMARALIPHDENCLATE